MIDVSSKRIYSLEGIGYFTELEYLDLAYCPALTNLECHFNLGKELDLSHNPNLFYLVCDENDTLVGASEKCNIWYGTSERYQIMREMQEDPPKWVVN